MKSGILICGFNGSGKSTVGKELAKTLNYKFMDIEDYYHPKTDSETDSGYKYDYFLSKKEVIELLCKDMKENKEFVMVSVKGDYGGEVVSHFDFVVIIDVPKEIRLERIKDRTLEKYGDRILQGGDLHKKNTQFFDMITSRSDELAEAWVNTINCSVMRIDGTKSISDNAELIIKELSELQGMK